MKQSSQPLCLDHESTDLLSAETMYNANLDNLTVSCSQKNNALFTCINNECKSTNPFICSIQQCQCQQSHQECQKASIKFFIKKFNQKLQKSSLIKNQLQQTIDHLIDQLSLLKDNIAEFKIDSNVFNTLETSFYKSLSTNTIDDQILGNMETLWKSLKQNEDNKKPTALDLLKTKFKDLQKTLQKNIESIKIYLTSQSIKITQLKAYQLFGKSSIQELSIRENVDKLKAFYPKTIKSAELLYKASENEFSTKKFYQIAGQQTNMMIICKTNKGKVIGAYTPLFFQSDSSPDYYVQDPTLSTFIFTLTENDKFIPKSAENAIYRVFLQQRVCFGGCEFQICDKANTIEKCRSYSLNYHFINKNYQSNKRQSFQRFNGNKNQFFSVIEWEAWKMQFQQK